MPSIWETRLRPLQNQILWWMIDAGALQGPLPRNWIASCAKDLGPHRVTITRNLTKMAKNGVLLQSGKGKYSLNPAAFESRAKLIPAKPRRADKHATDEKDGGHTVDVA